MNPNELADGILAIEERIFLTKKEHQLFQNSATMLRQQQAKIEALKANSVRYEWLRTEFAHGRETYLAEGIPSGESLDKYIDGKLK